EVARKRGAKRGVIFDYQNQRRGSRLAHANASCEQEAIQSSLARFRALTQRRRRRARRAIALPARRAGRARSFTSQSAGLLAGSARTPCDAALTRGRARPAAPISRSHPIYRLSPSIT